MQHVFISYVRENKKAVDELHEELKSCGIEVWRDLQHLNPGDRWKRKIRKAIREGGFFIACFSQEYHDRDESYMNEELTLAIERLRQLHIDRVWFMPVKLNKCEIPDIDIGRGETLQDLHYVKLYEDWDAGIQSILDVIQPESPASTVSGNTPETIESLKLFIAYSHKDTEAKDELITRLAVLKREGLIDLWHDNEILGSDKWREEIFTSNLSNSDILLYLVSADSLASENCNKELTIVLNEKIRVIPIILEDCDWLNHSVPKVSTDEGKFDSFKVPPAGNRFNISDILALPADGKPLNEWNPESKGWKSVVDGIRKVITEKQSVSDPLSGTSEKELRAEVMFERGNVQMMLRQMDEAVTAYSDAIEFNPGYALAYYNRATVYGIIGEHDKVIEDCTKALELNSSLDVKQKRLFRAAVCNNRGSAYSNKGEFESAFKDFNTAIKHKPDFAVAYYNRGVAYGKIGEIDQAIKDYTTTIKYQPKFAMACYNRGIAYFSKGNFDKAIEDCNQAIKHKSDFAIAYYIRGAAYSQIGDSDKAIEDYTIAIKLEPEFVEVYYDRGNTYKRIGKSNLAIDDYTKAIELKPDLAEAHVNRANTYSRNGKINLAIEGYTKAIKFKPNLVKAHINRGLAYAEKGNFAKAITDFTITIKLKPDFTEAYIYRGNVYKETSKASLAIADYTEVIERNPNAEVYFNRGVVYYEKSDVAKAIDDLSKAIKLNPDFADAYFIRSNAHAEKGDSAKALDDFSKAIELNPDFVKTIDNLSTEEEPTSDSANIYFNLGLVYFNNGDFDSAIDNYNKGIRVKPDEAEAYNNRGASYERKGNFDQAIRDYTQSIALKSNYAKAYVNRGLAFLHLQELEKAKADLTTARDMGMDIVAIFHSTFGSIANFERINGVQLPADIATLLTLS